MFKFKKMCDRFRDFTNRKQVEDTKMCDRFIDFTNRNQVEDTPVTGNDYVDFNYLPVFQSI